MEQHDHLPKVNLHPGEWKATDAPCVLHTLLGSCVSACLFDPVAKIAGMNHFLLANNRYAKDLPINVTDAGRYGVHAMELLINDMLKLGAVRRRIRAKAFGGGSIIEKLDQERNFLCVNEVNVRFIREFLLTEGIPLVEESLGGKQGRVISFRTDTYEVAIKPIVQHTTEQLKDQELDFWKRSIEDHSKNPGQVVLFK